MRKTVAGFIAIAGLHWFPTAIGAPGVEIVAIESPVWIQQADTKAAIGADKAIAPRDRLQTGETGRIALQLGPGTTLQLDVSSELEILALAADATGNNTPRAEIALHRGRACIQFRARQGAASHFSLLIGKSVNAAIHEQGDICVKYGEKTSSITLNEGTVQISNSIDPHIVVLSDAGSEYGFDDTGYYELSLVDGKSSIEVTNDETAALEPKTVGKSTDSQIKPGDSSSAGITDETDGTSEPTAEATSSGYIYTVYLFSTRTQEVADELNRKLQKAGHETRIFTSDNLTPTYYRIVVTGFASRQAAQDYSKTIVGKFGITDTWIGKNKIKQ